MPNRRNSTAAAATAQPPQAWNSINRAPNPFRDPARDESARSTTTNEGQASSTSSDWNSVRVALSSSHAARSSGSASISSRSARSSSSDSSL